MIAQAGKCPCGARIWRAEAEAGDVLTVDPDPVTSAAELRALAGGTPTYQLGWHRAGVTLTVRTERDVRLRPVGFRVGDRIVLPHRCADLHPAESRRAEDTEDQEATNG